MMTPPLDILPLAAHRDEVEQTGGGNRPQMRPGRQRTGNRAVNRGEAGTRGRGGASARRWARGGGGGFGGDRRDGEAA